MTKRPNLQYPRNAFDEDEMYIFDTSGNERHEYNIRKLLDTKFVHYYERKDKESLTSDLMVDYKLNVVRETPKKSIYFKHSHLTDLRESIKSENWHLLDQELKRVKQSIESGYLSKSIETLILATEPTDDLVDDNVYLKDVVSTLNAYFKEILVSNILDKKTVMRQYLMKCSEIVEYAIALKKLSDKEKLEPLRSSDLEQVDTFEGRAIYKVK